MKKEMDMLNGSIVNKILLFAFPLALSSILQQLFNAADVAVVGNFAGSSALAAVGANGPVINLLVNLFVGLSVGTNVVVASFLGMNDRKRASNAVHTSIIIALVCGLVLLIIGVSCARPILEFMSTPKDIIDLATLYLRIYFLGMPFVMLYNFTSAILRSNGDTKRPLIALFISGVINVILNLIFVIIFHMSVEGVAISTVISNVISSLILTFILFKEKGPLQLSISHLKVDKESLVRITKIGLPTGLQSTVFSISNIIIQTALNDLGSTTVAASAAALNYEYFSYYIVSAFSQTAVTFLGQNYSAKKYDRCFKIMKYSTILGIFSTVLITGLFLISHKFCISFFTTNPQVAKLAYTRMFIILSFEVLNLGIELLSGFMRSIGFSSTPALISVLGICGTRIFYVAFIYPLSQTFDTLLLVYPISWLITVIALSIAYFYIHKKAYRI